ncbi:MAG: exodeoxyribonuclease VII small subunit [candidate division Zixibacteria bacterium]|nr:exodeoxyribonuclease VII small subunit [candidate division Zixibacteria bacterium]
MAEKQDFVFEEGVQRLEEIVDRLSSEEVSLEESFKLYEEGSALVKKCAEILTQYEGKIKTLVGDADKGFKAE